MLNDKEITNFFNDTNIKLIDCCCKDELPHKRYFGNYIINMQNSTDGNGTHWVFLKIDNNKGNPIGIYFDSFGVYCPEDIKNFVHPLKIIYSNREIQNIKSEMCGYFASACAYYLSHDSSSNKCLEDNFNDFISMFSDNTKLNDSILKEYLKKNSVNKDF
jgi:hypothetical protein